MKTLKQAKVGETVKVVKLTGQGAVKRRAPRKAYKGATAGEGGFIIQQLSAGK